MSKNPSISTIATGYYSRNALNTNFENLRDGFSNTLSLDGSTPNAMGADFDMNHNSILNVDRIDVQSMTLDGANFIPSEGEIATSYASQSYTGDGTTVTYAMGFNPLSKPNVSAYIDGVYQNQDSYGISGTDLTFTEAPPLNSAIEIRVPIAVTSLTNTDASQLVYTQGDTGSVSRSVESRLQDYVSVKDFGAVGDGVTDDTAAIQAALDALPTYGTLDGQGGTYLVGNLWLKANMVMQNFNLQTIATNRTDVSPINIGNDLLTADGDHNSAAGTAAYNASRFSPGIENVTLENIHVFGDRGNQTCFNVNGQATRDGGLHGFCLKGFSTNVSIRNCSARYCATDGILIYRGLHATTVTEDDVCHNNLTIENSLFQWNRRHGGAGESINGARIVNCQWLDNGQDVNGGLTQGDKGATILSGGVYNQYANGFDMEGYGIGSRVLNITFQGCDGLRNVRDGILFYDIVDQDNVNFEERKNIRIIGCHLDYGTNNINGDYALTFTSTIGNKAKASLYNDIVIADCLFEGLFTFRSTDNVMISGLMQQVPGTSSVRAVLDYGTNIRFVGNNTNVTAITASNSTYNADDQFLYASATWDPGTILAGGVSNTTIAVSGAQYGDLVQLGHTSLNTAANAGLILTGFVVFPGGSVQVSMYNPTGGSKTVTSGTLKVRVSKYDAA